MFPMNIAAHDTDRPSSIYLPAIPVHMNRERFTRSGVDLIEKRSKKRYASVVQLILWVKTTTISNKHELCST